MHAWNAEPLQPHRYVNTLIFIQKFKLFNDGANFLRKRTSEKLNCFQKNDQNLSPPQRPDKSIPFDVFTQIFQWLYKCNTALVMSIVLLTILNDLPDVQAGHQFYN